MTADDTPAVPDTEAEREALAFLRPCDRAPGDLDAWLRESGHARDHAATVVRAALARDVPAGRDLTAQDVRDAHAAWLDAGREQQTHVEFAADYLNRIARPARDVPAPTDEPQPSTVTLGGRGIWHGENWTVEQTEDGDIVVHEPEGGESYEVPRPMALALGAAARFRSDRAGTAPTDDDRCEHGVPEREMCPECGVYE